MYSRKYIRPAMAAGSMPSERPSIPPDYAGVTFRPSDDRSPQDFPETLIPAVEAVAPPSSDAQSEPICLETQDADDAMTAPSFEERSPDGSFTEEIPDLPPELPLDAPTERSNDPSESSEAPVSLAEEQTAHAPLPSLPIEPTEGSDVGSPLEWLRALKMEDLLLLWMLLMLLYGESREEIDLLLGLLLFAGR